MMFDALRFYLLLMNRFHDLVHDLNVALERDISEDVGNFLESSSSLFFSDLSQPAS